MAAEEARREWFEKDYYAVLGVPEGAPAKEIKKAYKDLARKLHPDQNPGDAAAEERFKEVSGAYDVLGDDEKRKAYDRVREMGASGFGFPGSAGGWPGGRGGAAYETVDIGDLFGDLFGSSGGRRSSQQVRHGADLETEVTISFDDAMSGTTVPVRFSGRAVCRTCKGSGAAPGTAPVTCPTCAGSGQVSVNQGFFQMARTCPECGGTGRLIEHPCPTCRGSGSERRSREFSVKVPAGVKDGARIRLAGRGEPGPPGGRSGDLYVRVRVGAHRFFGRRGDDLTLDLPLRYTEAALGAHVQVPTLNGPVTLKVPSGTPSGKTFRIKGKGAPRRSGNGDLLVTVRVDVPHKLSRGEKELLKRLQEEEERSPRESLGVD